MFIHIIYSAYLKRAIKGSLFRHLRWPEFKCRFILKYREIAAWVIFEMML